jgi:ABC-type transporter Mla subunit MlaD
MRSERGKVQFEDKAQEQQKVVKSLLEQTQQAGPEDKARLEAEAKEAAKVLEDYRKNMRQLVDQAATVAKEARLAQQEALDSEKRAEKGTAKLE